MRPSSLLLAIVLLVSSCSRGIAPEANSSSFSRISAGDGFTCVIVDDGGVACWGNRAYMGAGFTPGDAALGISPPVAVSLPKGMRFTQVTSTRSPYGYVHACALASDGTAWCWGDNQAGQLGNGSDGGGEMPVEVSMPPETAFSQISAGAEHTCALDRDGAVWCWGDGNHGQLGDGHPNETEWDAGDSWHIADRPAKVALPGVVVERVASGAYRSCALTRGGEIWCWGGDGGPPPESLPVALATPDGVSFSDLVSDEDEMCGLTTDGAVWCWPVGMNAPDGGRFDGAEPRTKPMPDGVTIVRLSAGRWHMCALSSDGVVWCWGALGGYGTWGSYGGVRFPEEAAQTPIDLSSASGRRFADVAAGNGHTCAIATDSTVWCWGFNGYGQLGDGSMESSLLPVEVPINLSAPAPVASPQALLSLEPVVLEPYSGEVFLAPPPTWNLADEESRRIYGVFVGYNWQSPVYWGLPDKCKASDGDPGAPPEACMYAYFAREGVSLEALSLLNDYGLSVTRLAGEGPVWVADTYDWSTYGTNYDGATPNQIFTPKGIIDVSASVRGRDVLPLDLSPAYSAAFASDIDERIQVAAVKGFGSPNDAVLLGEYSENFEVPLIAPRRTPSGWAIPFSVQSGGGFHCCSYPFWARFELDLDAEADIREVRFLDWCYMGRVTFGSGGIPDQWPKVIRDLGATLPACATP